MLRPGDHIHPIRIAGTGSYLPGPPIGQDEVRAFLRRYPDSLSTTMQERLLRESGIVTRHYGIDIRDESRRETNTSMATTAARVALAAAGWRPADVDLLVVTTVVPDQLMPPNSTLVQEALGIERCAELAISANCTAPYKGLAFAASQLQLGICERALVCSVQFSSGLLRPPWTNAERMATNQGALRWIVGDGAGALALERGTPDLELALFLESNGVGERSGMSLGLGTAHPDLRGSFERGEHHVIQDDIFVLRTGMPRAIAGIERMFDTLGIDPRSIDHFLPAVSSMRLAETMQRTLADRCGIRPDAWRLNLSRVGYLGGVGFLVQLDELTRSGGIGAGDLLCACAEESSKWMSAGAIMRCGGR